MRRTRGDEARIKVRRFTPAGSSCRAPRSRSRLSLLFFKRRDGRGDRYGEVVQLDQGVWIYPARQGRQGCPFVHVSAVERAGLSSLNEGAKVSYEEVENRGKTSAENLRVG
jgi:cold shock CspA family protein